MDRKLKRQLIQVRRNVRRKLQALKEGLVGQQLLLSKQYEPLTKSIRDLKTNIADEVKKELKTEIKRDVEDRKDLAITSTPIKSTQIPIKKRTTDSFTNIEPQPPPLFLRLEPVGEIDTFQTDIPETSLEYDRVEESYQEARKQFLDYINGPLFQQFLEEFDPLPRYYVEGLIKDDTDQYNSDEYAIRRDKVRYEWKLNKFFIGDSEIEFIGPNLCIGGNVCYRGSTGLYELLFKKDVGGYRYSIQEKKDYADILKRTNAMYSLRSQTTKTGGLLLDYNEKPSEYVYFDDINELCERLKLLIASQHAGNTNHTNEIASILEELRECGIIV